MFSKAGAALVQRHISFKVTENCCRSSKTKGSLKRLSLTALLYAISSWRQNEFILTTVICFIIYDYSNDLLTILFVEQNSSKLIHCAWDQKQENALQKLTSFLFHSYPKEHNLIFKPVVTLGVLRDSNPFWLTYSLVMEIFTSLPHALSSWWNNTFPGISQILKPATYWVQ